MPLLAPFKTTSRLRPGATEALFVISFGSFRCPAEHQLKQRSFFEHLCDFHNIDLVTVTLPHFAGLPQPSRHCWQQHKLTIGSLIIEGQEGAAKDWARVCIVDETFRCDPMHSPFTAVPVESIGMALQDTFDGGTGQATMVVLSRALFGLFRRPLEELTAGSLWIRMQAMEDGQDRFVQYITEEAQRMEVTIVPISCSG
jgi:hypothetical protein